LFAIHFTIVNALMPGFLAPIVPEVDRNGFWLLQVAFEAAEDFANAASWPVCPFADS